MQIIKILIFLILVVLGSCKSSAELVENKEESSFVFYQGIGEYDEAFYFYPRDDHGYDVIFGDLKFNPIPSPENSENYEILIQEAKLYFYLPKVLKIQDYLVEAPPWRKNKCEFFVLKSNPVYFNDGVSWRHTIKSTCQNYKSGLFIFSQKFGLVAFFDLDKITNTNNSISGYIISGSSYGLGSKK